MTREERDELERQARSAFTSLHETWDDAEVAGERAMEHAGRNVERGGAEREQVAEDGEPRGEASRHRDEGDQRPVGREERHGRDNEARAKA